MEVINNQVSNATPVVSTTTNIPEVHPCQYCSKPCRGKQCKECHLKMIAKTQGKCMDCDKVFPAVRKDGTARKRCIDCHNLHLTNKYATCPGAGCGVQYHAFLDDGRVFDKCFECYNKSFSKCEKCGSKCFKDVKFCSPCFQENKKATYIPKAPRDFEGGDKPCKNANVGCKSTTNFTFCRDCNYKNKNLTNKYMIYSCEDCGYEGQGDYKKCGDCNFNNRKSR